MGPTDERDRHVSSIQAAYSPVMGRKGHQAISTCRSVMVRRYRLLREHLGGTPAPTLKA